MKHPQKHIVGCGLDSHSSSILYLAFSIFNFRLSVEFSSLPFSLPQTISFPVSHTCISIFLSSRVYCPRPGDCRVLDNWLISRPLAKSIFLCTVMVHSNLWHYKLWKQSCACDFLTSLGFPMFSQGKWAQVFLTLRFGPTRSLIGSKPGDLQPLTHHPHPWWLGLLFVADIPGVCLLEERNPNIVQSLSDYVLHSCWPSEKPGTLQSCPSGIPKLPGHLSGIPACFPSLNTLASFLLCFLWGDGGCSFFSQNSYEASGSSPAILNSGQCSLRDFDSHPRFGFLFWLNFSVSHMPWKISLWCLSQIWGTVPGTSRPLTLMARWMWLPSLP